MKNDYWYNKADVFKLPKKQENTNLETELLPTVHSPFEKYFLPTVVTVATLLVTGLAVAVIYYLKTTGKSVSKAPAQPTEDNITLSPFAPKKDSLDPNTGNEEILGNNIKLATGIAVDLDTDWQTLTTEDSKIHSMISFIAADEDIEATDSSLIQGEIEAYTPEHTFEDVMQTLAKSKEEFSTQTLGSYNVLVRKVYLLTGKAVVGEWKENNKILLIRVFASTMEEAATVFNRIAQTVKFE